MLYSRRNLLALCITSLGVYLLFVDQSSHVAIPDEFIEMDELESELEHGKSVKIVSYAEFMERFRQNSSEDQIPSYIDSGKDRQETMQHHRTWMWAEQAITRNELFPNNRGDLDVVLDALVRAQIVSVDSFNTEQYESGTSEKWVIHLEGGQKAMMKLMWYVSGCAVHICVVSDA